MPQTAVHDEGGILNVYVVGPNNRADMRIVRTGRTTSEGVEVITGLKSGDRVIVAASSSLHDDAPVEIMGR